MTKPKSPLSAFIGTSLSSVIVAFMTFVSGVLIARALGPEARAEYGTILIIGQMIAGLSTLSFFDGAIFKLRSGEFQLWSIFPTMLMAAIIIAVACSISISFVLPLLNLDLSTVGLNDLTLVVILLIFVELIGLCFGAVERSEMKFFLVNLYRVASPTMFSLLIVGAWLITGAQLSAALVVYLFILSKVAFLAVWVFRYRFRIIGSFDSFFFRDSAKAGLRLHVAFALAIIATQIDRLFAIGIWPKEILGQYFVAFSAVGAGFAVITTGIYTVLFPYLSGLKGEERRNRLALIIRLTLIISVTTVLIGAALLPYAIPFLYGEQYLDATPLALGLLCASSVLPLRAVVLEASRSSGRGRPSVEMALASIAVTGAMYLMTGFDTPFQLILAYGLSIFASMLVGARHLVADDIIRIDRNLVPGPKDVVRLREMLGRALRRRKA